MSARGRYAKLYGYIGKEYVLSFFIAFVFFFFIFFVNQILVLAQKILLKNVVLGDVLMLVVLSIPQFLMYTMPFSSLASASMVIGNLSSQNEVLALRSCGVHTNRIFVPIVGLSLVLSISTLFIADKMIPYTTDKYKELYAKMLESVPTLELESYSSTQFEDLVISNGVVDRNEVYDIMILDGSSDDDRVIIAEKGTFSVVDLDRFIYRIDMVEPRILSTDKSSLESFSLAEASSMTMYLDLSSNTSANISTTPSQMSIGKLSQLTEERKNENDSMANQKLSDLRKLNQAVAELLFDVEEDGRLGSVETLYRKVEDVQNRERQSSFSFYYQYYRTELQKKVALSLACTFLVFIAFPISFFRIKNGRLIGFGISMFIACMYWFFLYYMHIQAIKTAANPAFFIWLPNAVVFMVGVTMIFRLRRR